MAKVIEGTVEELFKRTREGVYPWDEWLDGQVRVLEAGKDFTCKPDSIRNAFYGAAAARGLGSRTKTLPSGDVRVVASKDIPIQKRDGKSGGKGTGTAKAQAK